MRLSSLPCSLRGCGCALVERRSLPTLIVDVRLPIRLSTTVFTFDGAYIGAFIQGQTTPTTFGLGVDFASMLWWTAC